MGYMSVVCIMYIFLPMLKAHGLSGGYLMEDLQEHLKSGIQNYNQTGMQVNYTVILHSTSVICKRCAVSPLSGAVVREM